MGCGASKKKPAASEPQAHEEGRVSPQSDSEVGATPRPDAEASGTRGQSAVAVTAATPLSEQRNSQVEPSEDADTSTTAYVRNQGGEANSDNALPPECGYDGHLCDNCSQHHAPSLVSVDALAQLLQRRDGTDHDRPLIISKGSQYMVLVDLRSLADFGKSHIVGACRGPALPTPSVFTSLLLAAGADTAQHVILYDESGDICFASPSPSLAVTLQQSEEAHQYPIKLLRGGWSSFAARYPYLLTSAPILRDEHLRVYPPRITTLDSDCDFFLGSQHLSADIDIVRALKLTDIVAVSSFPDGETFDKPFDSIVTYTEIATLSDAAGASPAVVKDTLVHAANILHQLLSKEGEQQQQRAHAVQHQSPRRRRVLVHCYRGTSRAPAVAVAYMMLHHQLTFQQALSSVADTLSGTAAIHVSLSPALFDALWSLDPTSSTSAVPLVEYKRSEQEEPDMKLALASSMPIQFKGAASLCIGSLAMAAQEPLLWQHDITSVIHVGSGDQSNHAVFPGQIEYLGVNTDLSCVDKSKGESQGDEDNEWTSTLQAANILIKREREMTGVVLLVPTDSSTITKQVCLQLCASIGDDEGVARAWQQVVK